MALFAWTHTSSSAWDIIKFYLLLTEQSHTSEMLETTSSTYICIIPKISTLFLGIATIFFPHALVQESPVGKQQYLSDHWCDRWYVYLTHSQSNIIIIDDCHSFHSFSREYFFPLLTPFLISSGLPLYFLLLKFSEFPLLLNCIPLVLPTCLRGLVYSKYIRKGYLNTMVLENK